MNQSTHDVRKANWLNIIQQCRAALLVFLLTRFLQEVLHA